MICKECPYFDFVSKTCVRNDDRCIEDDYEEEQLYEELIAERKSLEEDYPEYDEAIGKEIGE